MRYEFTIPGEPVAKGRARFTRTGRPWTPKKTARFENLVSLAFTNEYPDAIPTEDAVSLEIISKYAVPPSWSKKKKALALIHKIFKTSRPDLDNLIKSISDGLNGIAWKDDAQVYELYARKEYSDHAETIVTIRTEEEKDGELK